MTPEEARELLCGLYRIHWKNDGGESLAAVGMMDNGNKWLAPINWVAPTTNQKCWEMIDHVEKLKH